MENLELLKEVHKKRNFDVSSEPFGKIKNNKDKEIFVIQKHQATHLHYDFSMTAEGVLKS